MQVIQDRLSEKPDQGALGAGPQDQGAQIQKLLQAKKGKQVSGTGPRASSLAEQQAVTQTGQALGQIQQAGQIKGLQQQQQAEAQDQAADIQADRLQLARDRFKQESANKIENVLADFNRAKQEQNFKETAAAAEQAGILGRLSADKYVNELQLEGSRARLDDQLSFKEQMQKVIYDDMQDLYKDNLQFQTLMNADQREFNEEIAQMDIETAMRIVEQDIKAAQQTAMYSGISEMVSGGLSAAYKVSSDSKGTSADTESSTSDSFAESTGTVSELDDYGAELSSPTEQEFMTAKKIKPKTDIIGRQ